jgi:hypothetical protein
MSGAVDSRTDDCILPEKDPVMTPPVVDSPRHWLLGSA